MGYLTEDDVRLIRSEFMKNSHIGNVAYSQAVRVFAEKFNVTRTAIYDVIRFRTWKTVPANALEEDPGLTRSLLELEKLDPFDGIFLE